MRGTTALHTVSTYLSVVAPDIFFVTSGYLVTASLLKRQHAMVYLHARFLRIFPALLVTVLITVFLIGAVVTTLPLLEYVRDGQTWMYVLRNLTLVAGVSDTLPGVYTAQPLPDSVNGSLWTMPTEIRLYLLLLLLWWLTRRAGPRQEAWLGATIAAGAVGLGALKVWLQPTWGDAPINVVRLAPLFLIGSAMYLWRRHIPLRRDLFWLCLAAMLASLPWMSVFLAIELVTIGYVTLYLAYVPGGAVRQFNHHGDCSYGIYIQSYPLQQLIVYLLAGHRRVGDDGRFAGAGHPRRAAVLAPDREACVGGLSVRRGVGVRAVELMQVGDARRVERWRQG